MLINGVDYRVKWHKLEVGWSFFLPVFDWRGGVEESLGQELMDRGIVYEKRRVIENGVPGIRIWRIK
jgi:hypothetical protein